MNEEIRKQFEDLACALSPENLSCDGELSRAQTDAKHKKLMKQWHDLEKKVGRKVTEDEIWEEVFKK